MKKICAFILTLAMVLSLTACGGSKEEAPASSPAAPSTSTSTPAASEEATSEWPSTSVQLILAAAVGGGTDLICRNLLLNLSEVGNFAVVNNTDGAGAVAYQEVASADPEKLDKIMFFNTSYFTSYFSGVTDLVPFEDLIPVWSARPAGNYYLIVPNESPFNSVQDVVDYCHANPGQLGFGCTMGDLTHVMAGAVAQILDVEWSWVACGSDSDRATMIMGNNLEITLCNQMTVENYVESEDFKILCSLQDRSPTASEKLASYPTLSELGFDPLKIFVPVTVYVPAGTSEADMTRINEVFNAAAEDPRVVEAIAGMNDKITSYGNLEETQAALHELHDQMYASCKELGLAVI